MAIPFYARLLDSIFSGRRIDGLRQAHALITCLGIAGNDLLRTKLAAAYSNCGFLRESRQIFLRANRRPVFLYNALIRAYADRRFVHSCVGLYKEMIFEGKLPDPRTIASVLRACAAVASLRYGSRLHCVAVVLGFSSEVAVENSLVSMYAKCGDISCARKVFEKMPKRTVVSWTTMVSGLGAHGCSVDALQVFDEMLSSGCRPDAMAVTAVLSACSHGGMVEAGERFFREMEERFRVRPTVEHLTCMVDMMGRSGRLEEAEALVQGMKCAPDEALWGALLTACKAHGKLDMALRVAQRACSAS